MNTLNHDPLNFAFLSLCCGIAFLFYFTMTSQPLLKHFFLFFRNFKIVLSKTSEHTMTQL